MGEVRKMLSQRDREKIATTVEKLGNIIEQEMKAKNLFSAEFHNDLVVAKENLRDVLRHNTKR